MDNGWTLCGNLLRFYFFDGTCHCNSCLYLFALDCLASKKSSGRNGLLLVVIYFDFVDCYRRISIPYVTRRFDTTLDKFKILTQTYQLVLSKHHIGNLVDNKVF